MRLRSFNLTSSCNRPCQRTSLLCCCDGIKLLQNRGSRTMHSHAASSGCAQTHTQCSYYRSNIMWRQRARQPTIYRALSHIHARHMFHGCFACHHPRQPCMHTHRYMHRSMVGMRYGQAQTAGSAAVLLSICLINPLYSCHIRSRPG